MTSALLAVAMTVLAGVRVLDLSGTAPAAAYDVPPVPADAGPTPLRPPPTAPAGEGGYAFLHTAADGSPVAFDPCRPVHYVVRRAEAPAGADAVLSLALAEVSTATGLVFVPDGLTDEPLTDDRAPLQRDRYGDRWAPVLVTWSDERETPRLRGRVAGFAGPVAVDPDGRGPRLVTGTVVLDRGSFAAAGDHGAMLAVAVHELGHLVGLAHVDDRYDTMHREGTTSPRFTDGARRGLARLGRGRCFSS